MYVPWGTTRGKTEVAFTALLDITRIPTQAALASPAQQASTQLDRAKVIATLVPCIQFLRKAVQILPIVYATQVIIGLE